MMKKRYYLAFVAIVGLTFSSCGMFDDKDPEWRTSDLWGLWQRSNSQEFFRFTEEQSDEAGYLLGLEWDEADDKHEQDRWDARDELGHPGNGWFKYKLDKANLEEIILMDNEGAESSKLYVVTKLNASTLEYYEKDHTSITYKFTKVKE